MVKKFNNLGFKLLGFWLVLKGLATLFSLYFEGIEIVMGALALIAGILIIAGK